MKKKAKISIRGAYCGACTYAIEHAGRKLPGISDVFVDIVKQEISVIYEGNWEILKELIKMVDKLGHEACIIDQNVYEVETN